MVMIVMLIRGDNCMVDLGPKKWSFKGAKGTLLRMVISRDSTERTSLKSCHSLPLPSPPHRMKLYRDAG